MGLIVKPQGFPETRAELERIRDSYLVLDRAGSLSPSGVEALQQITGMLDTDSAKQLSSETSVPTNIRYKMGWWADPKIKLKILANKYGEENVYIDPETDALLYREVDERGNIGPYKDSQDTGVLTGQDFAEVIGQSPKYIAAGIGAILTGGVGAAVQAASAGIMGALGYAAERNLAAGQSGVEGPLPTEKDVQNTAAAFAGAELLGIGLMGATKKIMAPGKKSLTATDYEIMDLGKQYDIPWQPSDVRQTRNLALLEGTLDKMIGGAGVYQKSAEKRLMGVQRLIEGETKKIGYEPLGRVEAGEVFQEGLQKSWRGFQEQAKPYFQAVADAAGNSPAPIRNYAEFVAGLEKRSGVEGLVDGSILSKLQRFAKTEAVAPKTEGGLAGAAVLKGEPVKPYMRLYEIRSAMSKEAMSKEVLDRKGYSYYSEGLAALQKDIDQYATKSGIPEVLAASKRAREFYAGEMDSFGKKLVQRFQRSDAETEKLAMSLYSGKQTGVSNILAMKGILKTYSPETWDKTVEFLLTEMFEKSTVPFNTSKGIVDMISPRKLTTEIAKFGDDYLSSILDVDQRAVLDTIVLSGRRLQAAEALAGNTSGTGQIVLTGSLLQRLMQEGTMGTRAAMAGGIGAGAAGGDMTWAVAGIAGVIGGTAGLAKFMTSRFGRKWLIDGFNIPMEKLVGKAVTLGSQVTVVEE